MEKTVFSDITPEEWKSLSAALEEANTEMASALEQMKKDQEEIDRLKIQTRAILDEIKTSQNHV